MTPLVPGTRLPLVPATAYLKASRNSTLSSVQFPWMPLLLQNHPKFLVWPCISLCSGNTAIFNNRNVQWGNSFPLPVFSQTCHLPHMQVIPLCGDSPSFSIAFNRSNIYYPRVSISSTYDLREIFKGLGVTYGFINHTDLSGIAGKVILWKLSFVGLL